MEPATTDTPSPEIAPKKPVRLSSLDAMRGLTVALMLLVNNVALDYQTPSQLQHAPWGAGITIADMVFPWFLFCAGVSIPFSVDAARRKAMLGWRHDARVLYRAAALVVLGGIVQSAVENRFAPSLGVLGLIGLSTLVGSFLYDLPPFRRAFVTGLLLIAYGLALLYLPHNGGIVGLSESKNLVQHLNQNILGRYYLNGLPSVVPAGALVAIGTLVGEQLLPEHRRHFHRLTFLFAVAVALFAIGYLWSGTLPMSKTIWTSSYILVAAGFGTGMLAAFYMVMDLWGVKRWGLPLIVFGSNAIVAYVVPILVKVLILQKLSIHGVSLMDGMLSGLKHTLGDFVGGWFYTIAYIVVWWVVLLALYRQRWFLKV